MEIGAITDMKDLKTESKQNLPDRAGVRAQDLRNVNSILTMLLACKLSGRPDSFLFMTGRCYFAIMRFS